MTDTRLCPMPHRDDKQRRAAASSQLCTSCGDRAAQQLHRLPALHAQLLHAHQPPAGTQQRVTGTKNPGLPFNPDVAHQRQVIEVLLHSWTRIVAEERKLAGPDVDSPRVLAGWLGRHLPWALTQPWADEFAENLDTTARESHGLCYPNGRRRFEIGPCIETGCAGRLWALVAPQDDLLPSALACAACGVEVTADRWLTYGRRLHTEQVA